MSNIQSNVTPKIKKKPRRETSIKITGEINGIDKKKRKKKRNQELVLWKDIQDWQTFNQSPKEKYRDDPNK